VETFELLLNDRRYAEPVLVVISVSDEQRAREWAGRLMAESPDCQEVEVCQLGKRLFSLDREHEN